MKLIKFSHCEDFGHDWYVQVLFTKCWALFQGSVSWNDFPSWPYLQIKSGNGCILSIMFWAHRFGIDVGIIERTWNWNYQQDIDFDTSLDDVDPTIGLTE
jgi:hypothetical protein